MDKRYFERTAKYLFARWQSIKHNDEFVGFCDKYKEEFEEDGMLNIDPWGDCLNDMERIKDRFGLDLIYHYSTQIPIDDIINALIFKDPFAMRLIHNSDNMNTDGAEGGKNEDTPCNDAHPIEMSPQIGGNNKIYLEVNIGRDIPQEQLKAEFLEIIRHCRFVFGIENKATSIPSETDFRIYDRMLEYERQGHKSYHRKIMEEVWPEDYSSATEGAD